MLAYEPCRQKSFIDQDRARYMSNTPEKAPGQLLNFVARDSLIRCSSSVGLVDF
jgi:hypothetical protein